MPQENEPRRLQPKKDAGQKSKNEEVSEVVFQRLFREGEVLETD